MALEDVGAVEGFLHRRTGAGAEAADHRAFVVRERVALAIVFPGESFLGVFAGGDGAFFGAGELVREVVGT